MEQALVAWHANEVLLRRLGVLSHATDLDIGDEAQYAARSLSRVPIEARLASGTLRSLIAQHAHLSGEELFEYLVALVTIERAAALPDLRQYFTHPEPFPRGWAIMLIPAAAPDQATAAEMLIGLMGEENADVRSRAMSVLAQLPRTAKIVESVAAMLVDHDPDVRRAAVDTLSSFGADADPVLDRLRAVARSDPDRYVQMAATAALDDLERKRRIGR